MILNNLIYFIRLIDLTNLQVASYYHTQTQKSPNSRMRLGHFGKI